MEMAPLLGYEDGVSALVVLLLVEVLKQFVTIKARYLPLVPIGVGLVVGIFAASQLPWPGWWLFAARAVDKGLRSAALAMAAYKLWRTTIKGIGEGGERRVAED